MKIFKNKSDRSLIPCDTCPKAQHCPFLSLDHLGERALYCNDMYDFAMARIKAKKAKSQWEPMVTMPLPYYAN